MTTKRLQFTDWLPDQPANAGSLNDAKNVYPLGIGYGAFPSAEIFLTLLVKLLTVFL